jgi:hypothetical protein
MVAAGAPAQGRTGLDLSRSSSSPAINLTGQDRPRFIGVLVITTWLTMTDGTESGVFGYGLAVTSWQLQYSLSVGLWGFYFVIGIFAHLCFVDCFCLVVYDICHADFL